MLKNFRVWLMVTIIALTAGVQTFAALPPRAKHTAEKPATDAYNSNQAINENAEDDDAPGGHGGHHGGGHHSGGHHGGGHFHVSHSHHSYHSQGGHHHHYATHYHHYHHHYHSYHADSDYASWSIVFDVLGLIPIFLFSVFGVLFGIAGIIQGKRRKLARAGTIIGIIEIIVLAILVAAFHVI